jgi:transposase-like protein
MEQLEGVPQEGRYHAKGNYDRRFIVEVIKEIEEGLPLQAACTKYNLNKQSVRRWLTDPGFRHVKTKRRSLSVQDKRSIVRAIKQEGLNYKEAAIAYQISVKAIQNWEKEFAAENAELATFNQEALNKKKTEQPVSTDSEQVHQLRQQLAEAQLKIAALNTLIDVAEQQLKIDIRKKRGARQSLK